MNRIIFCYRMVLKKFSVFYVLLFICLGAADMFAQASLQRGVNISNPNGNIVSIQTGLNPQGYSLILPLASNPSPTTASLLYGSGSGKYQLDECSRRFKRLDFHLANLRRRSCSGLDRSCHAFLVAFRQCNINRMEWNDGEFFRDYERRTPCPCDNKYHDCAADRIFY